MRVLCSSVKNMPNKLVTGENSTLWNCVMSPTRYLCYLWIQQRLLIFFSLWRCAPTRAMASSFVTFLDHKQRRTTVGRIPLDARSARRWDLYLTTLTTDIHAAGGIRTHNLSRRAAVDLSLRPRSNWDRQRFLIPYEIAPSEGMIKSQ